jgi:hypothetical protein
MFLRRWTRAGSSPRYKLQRGMASIHRRRRSKADFMTLKTNDRLAYVLLLARLSDKLPEGHHGIDEVLLEEAK